MKKNIIIIAIAALAFTSCVGDLDQAPRANNTIPSDEVYGDPTYRKGMLAKIYGGFTLVGQNGPGNADISVDDAGESEFLRAWWSIQTISTDEAKCVWGNSWNTEMNKNAWTTTKNSAIYATYTRAVMMVTFANDFLRNTNDSDPEIAIERAEVRFLRAYAYWVLLDCFGNPPFVDETTPIGSYKPKQITASELFVWLYDELKVLTGTASKLKAAHTQTYPRVDQGAANGLLARLCLNHKTYLGHEDMSYYTDAMTAAEVVNGAYTLASNYKALFMGDNGQSSDALQEIVYASCYDASKTQSYGGPTFFIAASKNSNSGLGLQAGWSGLVMSSEFAANIIGQAAVDGASAPSPGDFTSVDKRGLISLELSDDKEMNAADFSKGWHVVKFDNNRFNDPSTDYSTRESFASVDFPMIRVAETYLIYAEASARKSGGMSTDSKAYGYINALRTRAGVSAGLTVVTLDDVFNEITRELYWEGLRRTTLIRYDRYTSGTYLWPFKGGVKGGQALEEHLKLFPLPADDLQANKNLVQNPGYTK